MREIVKVKASPALEQPGSAEALCPSASGPRKSQKKNVAPKDERALRISKTYMHQRKEVGLGDIPIQAVTLPAQGLR